MLLQFLYKKLAEELESLHAADSFYILFSPLNGRGEILQSDLTAIFSAG
jgi:hypothetical protein